MGPIEAQMSPQPMLLHFDVNKTVMLTDSMDAKSHEECIREAVADLFWGRYVKNGDSMAWDWMGDDTIRSHPPSEKRAQVSAAASGAEVISYADYCKKLVKDKKDRKAVLRGFTKAQPETKAAMEKVVKLAVENMQLPGDVRCTEKARREPWEGENVGVENLVVRARLAHLNRSHHIHSLCLPPS